jgi:hypothetical protein
MRCHQLQLNQRKGLNKEVWLCETVPDMLWNCICGNDPLPDNVPINGLSSKAIPDDERLSKNAARHGIVLHNCNERR